MLLNILTYKEFNEIYEHCRACKSGYAIKDFSDDLFREFGKSNTNLALSIMEYTESKQKSLIGFTELYRENILNFSEELPQIKDAAIEYFYSYLTHIQESGKFDIRIKDDAPVLFETNLKTKSLEIILGKLMTEEFCLFSSFSAIRWIFYPGVKNSSGERIIWTDKPSRAKNANYQTLIFFLQSVIPGLDLGDRGRSIREVIKRFNGIDSAPMTSRSFRSVYNRYTNNFNDSSKRVTLLKSILG